MIKSIKANLLLNINDTHNVLCTTYFAIVWCKKYCQFLLFVFSDLWISIVILMNCLFYFNAQTTCQDCVDYSAVYCIGLNQPWPICFWLKLLVIKFLSQFKFQIIFLLRFSAIFMYFRLSTIPQKKKDHSLASFQEDWLTKEEFRSWLRKVEKNHRKCIVLFAVKQMEDYRSYSLIKKEKCTVS